MKNNINNIIDNYELMLKGLIDEKVFWKNRTDKEIQLILYYLIHTKLKFNIYDVVNNLNYNLLIKYKFKFILRYYNLSPYLFLNKYYIKFNKCDSLLKTKGKWSKYNIKKKIIKLCDLYNLDTDEKILNTFTIKFLKDNNCKNMLYVYENGTLIKTRSLFELLDIAYPKRFKSFQMKRLKRNYWSNKNNVYEALQYILELKKINSINARYELKSKFFYECNLSGLLAHYNYSYKKILDFLDI